VPIPMDSLFTQYFERQNRRRVGENAKANAALWLGRFNLWCLRNRVAPKTATIEDVEAFFDQLEGKFKLSTIKLGAVQIKAAYKYGHSRGVITANPTVDLYLPNEPDRQPVIFSSAELRHIFSKCQDGREWTIAHLAAYAGLRRGEIRELRKEHVDLKRETLTVIAGKGAKIRIVPIHPVLAEVLAAPMSDSYPPHIILNKTHPHDPLGNGHFEQVFPPVLRRAGVKGSTHTFRKTLTSSLMANGANPVAVDRLFGWTARDVRSRYYTNVADSLLQETILLAYRDDPISDWKRSSRDNPG
jgi:integrase